MNPGRHVRFGHEESVESPVDPRVSVVVAHALQVRPHVDRKKLTRFWGARRGGAEVGLVRDIARETSSVDVPGEDLVVRSFGCACRYHRAADHRNVTLA